LKENTKYHDYRFVGEIDVDEIEPWFDSTTAKPWDDPEIPWVLDNKVRREILIKLTNGPKSFTDIYNNINFSPKPLLITKDEYECKISYQWTKETIENHLMNLEWYHLIKVRNNKYELNIPILSIEKSAQIEKYVIKFAETWIHIIEQLKNEINKNITGIQNKTLLYEILIKKAVENLYKLLKKEKILPNKPNIKTFFAEQLRSIKFEEWVAKNF
jgi:hypothetical protein